jgi:hypothetical protein
LSPFWKSWAILANCGYLPILIEFANFRKCCIFSHFGKGSPFLHVNNFDFFRQIVIFDHFGNFAHFGNFEWLW